MKVTINGVLDEVKSAKPGKIGVTQVFHVAEFDRSGGKKIYPVLQTANTEADLFSLKSYMGEQVNVECYLNSNDYHDANKGTKHYLSLKMIGIKRQA
jgi:hypothetical protein